MVDNLYASTQIPLDDIMDDANENHEDDANENLEDAQQRLSDDRDYLSGVVGSFLARKEKWTMTNVVPVFNKLASDLHAREATRGEMHANNYVSLELLPSILYFIAKKLVEELPESCKLTRDREEQFVLNLLSIMNHDSFPRGLTMVQNFEELLYPDCDARWSRELHDDLALHLRNKAQAQLECYQRCENESESEETRRKNRAVFLSSFPDFDGQRIFNVANGHFPCGFNTFEEQRYVYYDMRYLLFPGVDIKCEKRISSLTNNYILRSAQEILEAEIVRDDQDATLMEHLHDLVERGYPKGYTVVDAEDHECVSD